MSNISFTIHPNIASYLLEQLNTSNIQEAIVEKLKQPETGGVVLNKQEVDSIKKTLNIKYYALFYSEVRPSENENIAKFRKNVSFQQDKTGVTPWVKKQIYWAREKRLQYLDILEQLGEQNISIFNTLDQEIPQSSPIKERANLIRQKVNALYFSQQTKRPNAGEFLRGMIYALEELGILVFSSPYSNGWQGFAISYDTYPIIFFNSGFSTGRSLFTIAHELGHLILHRGDNVLDQELTSFSNDLAKEEVEANRFAAHFLMPEDDFTKEYNRIKENTEIGGKLLDQLSTKFYTSKQSVFWHIQNLNLANQNELAQLRKVAYPSKPPKDKESSSGSSFGTSSNPIFNTVTRYGVLATYRTILAKNRGAIDSKDVYNFFQDASNPTSLSLNLYRVERAFLEGRVI
ncbi:MAG: ImmA/IrrE family metallo-endopeptidase [Spirochaetia bacterium]